jgi:hypothetical protein
VLIERWRRHYNTKRPHSSLGYRPPTLEKLLSASPLAYASPRQPSRRPPADGFSLIPGADLRGRPDFAISNPIVVICFILALLPTQPRIMLRDRGSVVHVIISAPLGWAT